MHRPKPGQATIKLKVGKWGGGWVGGECSEIVSPEFRHSPNTVERWSDEEKEQAGGKEYGRRGFQQELCLSVNRAGSQQGHYLAPNLSSGTALKGCLCLGLMRKAQDAMSEGNNQHGPFITLAACAPGQGPRLISVEMKSMTSPSVKLRAGNSPVTPTGLQASCDPLRKVTFTLLWRRERERCRRFQPM